MNDRNFFRNIYHIRKRDAITGIFGVLLLCLAACSFGTPEPASSPALPSLTSPRVTQTSKPPVGRYKQMPDACELVPRELVLELVGDVEPKPDDVGADTETASTETSTCSWSMGLTPTPGPRSRSITVFLYFSKGGFQDSGPMVIKREFAGLKKDMRLGSPSPPATPLPKIGDQSYVAHTSFGRGEVIFRKSNIAVKIYYYGSDSGMSTDAKLIPKEEAISRAHRVAEAVYENL